MLKTPPKKPHVLLVRKAHFAAAHRLYNPNKDLAWNQATYGPCARENGHGHNYEFEVSIIGTIDPETGMVMNLKDLAKIIDKAILDKVDHYHLNYDVDFLKDINPTAENLAMAFWQELEKHLPNNALYKLRLWETERNIVEIVRD
jgi:6-pyruvoyltetrahydropterin/6-carboxytetrahydropterin synthase